MVTRTLKIIGALLLCVVGFAGTTHAYPPGGTVVTTDRSSYLSGSTVSVTAAGFQACAGQVVTFTITLPGGPTTTITIPGTAAGFKRTAAQPAATSPQVATGNVIVLTAIANADGTATVTLIAPATLGIYTVVATSPGCPPASTTFTVSRLPATGNNTQSWVVTGAALLLTGVGFWFVARRRRHPAAAE